MIILFKIQALLCFIFIGLAIATLIAAFVVRLIKIRHIADILELFAAGFFLIFCAQYWITYGYSIFTILLISLSVLVAIYKVIFFIRGK